LPHQFRPEWQTDVTAAYNQNAHDGELIENGVRRKARFSRLTRTVFVRIAQPFKAG